MNVKQYVLVPPRLLGDEYGYAYGAVCGRDGDRKEVELVATGFHEDSMDVDGRIITIDPVDFEDLRQVSEEEAYDGIGTYLSAMAVTIFDPEDGSEKKWRYGTIIDYNFAAKMLTMHDNAGRFLVKWTGADGIELVNEAIYALAPYDQRSTVEVKDDDLYDEFKRIKTLMDGPNRSHGKRKAEALCGNL
jgi:hypothetical protein